MAWTPPSSGAYEIYAVIDPENAVAETYENNNVLHRRITVLPPDPDEIAPHVDSFTINGGAGSTSERNVQLNTTVSDEQPGSGVARLYFVEYEYSQAANQWTPVRQSGWLEYASANSNYSWQLLPTSGMKFLQVWAADGAGNISVFPGKAYVNFAPAVQRVRLNQRRVYGYPLTNGQALTARLEPVSGDPDLYLWAPDHATRPPWVSNLRQGVDDLSIEAPVSGIYQVEVFGYSAAEYRLIVNTGAVVEAVSGAETAGGRDPSKEEIIPSQPLLAIEDEPAQGLGLPTPGQIQPPVLLPLIRR